MLIKMMYSYMEVAPQTVISFDLYEKLCGLSKSFKKLFDKARTQTASLVNHTQTNTATY